MLPRRIRRALKDLAYRTPAARFLMPRYHYNFRPAQLGFLVSMLDEVRFVDGAVIEVGCFACATTIYLREHLADLGRRRRYLAIDTFDGFLVADVDYEIRERAEVTDRHSLDYTGFSINRRSWVERSLALSGHGDVELVQGDAGALDYGQFAPISFALIDVDLYQPVSRALRSIAPFMSPGGRIVVDDCLAGNIFDGALQAYTEWCGENARQPEIVHGRLGVIRF